MTEITLTRHAMPTLVETKFRRVARAVPNEAQSDRLLEAAGVKAE